MELFFISSPIIVIIFFVFIKRIITAKKLKRLRDSWGTIPGNAFDIETAKIFFENNKLNSIKDSYCIDNDTWRDLDLNEIFTLINRAMTPIGAQYLFYLLKHPVISKDILNNREELINYFSKNQYLREKVQLSIQSLDGMNAKYIPHLLWGPLPDKPAYAMIIPLLSLFSLSILLLVLFKIAHFSILIMIFAVNLIIRYLVSIQK